MVNGNLLTNSAIVSFYEGEQAKELVEMIKHIGYESLLGYLLSDFALRQASYSYEHTVGRCSGPSHSVYSPHARSMRLLRPQDVIVLWFFVPLPRNEFARIQTTHTAQRFTRLTIFERRMKQASFLKRQLLHGYSIERISQTGAPEIDPDRPRALLGPLITDPLSLLRRWLFLRNSCGVWVSMESQFRRATGARRSC